LSPDQINGTFEFLAAVFIMLHIRQILKDKLVKGVSILATIFFFAWGVWNVYFYPSQGLWWSFYGGLCVVLTNLIYVVALLYYRKPRPKKVFAPKWALMFCR
jgi:hypothetical protein